MTKTLKAPANLKTRTNGMNIGLEETDIQIAGDIDIPDVFFNRLSSGIKVIDDLVGLFVPGAVITVASPRGVGKTTLLLQLNQGFQQATTGLRTLYVSGEEHVAQLAYSCQRLGTTDVAIANKSLIENILPLFEKFNVVVIDSLAAMTTNVEGVSKHDMEVWAMQQLYKRAKETNTVCIIILHCTKSGDAKGNSALQHICDCCVELTKMDQESFGPGARNIEVSKNRFGSTGNISLRMTQSGWDFENPIDESEANNKNGGQVGVGGQRAERKSRELQNLVEFLKSKGTIKEVDITKMPNLPSDISAFDRHVRLLKSLCKMGKCAKVGDQFSLVP